MDKTTIYHIYAYDYRDGKEEGFYRKIEMPCRQGDEFLYLNPEFSILIENFAKIYFPECYLINFGSEPPCWDWSRDIGMFVLELTDDRENHDEEPIGILVINDADIDKITHYYMEDLKYKPFIEQCLKNR